MNTDEGIWKCKQCHKYVYMFFIFHFGDVDKDKPGCRISNLFDGIGLYL